MKVELSLVTTEFTEKNLNEKACDRFNYTFEGRYDGEVEIDHDEVTDYLWFNLDDLDQMIAEEPGNFTPSFIYFLKLWKDKSSVII